ncbi:MAG: MOSC domain-containing protein, partial [Chloroflexota bacterium]
MSQPGTPRLLSIQVGQPQTLGAEGARNPMDRRWTSGIFKQPVAGPVRLGWTNLELDAQADLSVHGGPDKAVCVYAADHYAYWRTNLRRADLPYGAFGENFTVAGMDETEVCIGDVFAVGQAQVQVSQPRQPCWKLARRWRVRDLAARVERMGYTGWYFRVLAEGIVAAGD